MLIFELCCVLYCVITLMYMLHSLPCLNGCVFFYFQRLRQSGAFITTSECILFSLLGSAKHPNFKEVQALVKTSAPDSGLLSKV